MERGRPSPAEAQAWTDCELASLVENRFFTRLDLASLSPASRANWTARAKRSNEIFYDSTRLDSHRIPFWLTDGNSRVGTVALHPIAETAAPDSEDSLVGLSSLFVFPHRRAEGLASRAIRRIDEAARSHGAAGVRIATHWAWQSAARLYAFKLGMWVLNWKSALVFAFDRHLPPGALRIDLATKEIHFDVNPTRARLVSARAEGNRLVWRETLDMQRLQKLAPTVARRARQTTAVALALSGFPLVRSGRHWKQRWQSVDGGEPEGLAQKIAVFERRDKNNGFELRTPRIPGLRYGP